MLSISSMPIEKASVFADNSKPLGFVDMLSTIIKSRQLTLELTATTPLLTVRHIEKAMVFTDSFILLSVKVACIVIVSWALSPPNLG